MNNEPKVLQLTTRELTEIKHALFYMHECNHGTVGHNMLIIIAKMAAHLGFYVAVDGTCISVYTPEGVEVADAQNHP